MEDRGLDMNKQYIEKLEELLGKVETHVWHMEQRLPEHQKKIFCKEVRETMYDSNNIIVSRSQKYVQKEGS